MTLDIPTNRLQPPLPARKAVLVTLLAPAEERERQDCARCRTLPVCWRSKLTEDQRIVNLLVCRLRRGIEIEASTRVLMQQLRRKMRSVAMRIIAKTGTVRRNGRFERRDLIDEMQSVIIESLLTQYHMGEVMHPLRWLFGKPNGAVTRWAARKIREHQRDLRGLWFYGTTGCQDPPGHHEPDQPTDLERRLTHHNQSIWRRWHTSASETAPLDIIKKPDEYRDDAELQARTDHARDLVDDGVTLSLAEYRTLRFCLNNARDKGDPLNGVQRKFAELTTQPRRRITWHYGRAVQRLLEASGAAEEVFRSKGLRIPTTAESRRRRWRQRRPQTESLSAAEIADMLEIRAEKPQVSAAEIAWLFGVSADFVFRLQRRFRGQSREQIQRICNP